MQKFFILLTCLFATTTVAIAQKKAKKEKELVIKYGEIPEEDLKMTVYAPDSSAAAVVLAAKGRLSVEYNFDGFKLHRHVLRRVKLLKKSAFESEGNISIPYRTDGNFEDIWKLSAAVIQPDGTRQELTKKDFFNEKTTAQITTRKFAFPNLQEGSIIEYEYEMITKERLFQLYDWYFQENIPVRHSELSLSFPSLLTYAFLFKGQENLKRDDKDGTKFYADSLPALRREDIGIYEVTSPKEATFKVRMVVTIFKESHPYKVFPVGYDKNTKIKNLKARYYDAMGKLVRKVEKEEVKDIASSGGGTLYSDARVKYVENEYGVLPYTFEIEYEGQYSSIQSYPPWSFQNFGVGVQRSEFTMIMPKDMGLNHRLINTTMKPTIVEKNNSRTFHWEMSNLVPIASEPFMPSNTGVLPHLELSPQRFGVDKVEGSMKDWTSFGKFMGELNQDRDKVSAEMAGKIKDMTASCKTNLEKIDTLYHYMQQNMRYVSVQLGIGGWQTFDAQYVEKNKYGDCKALSNFMKSMLKSVGVESNLVVVSAGEDDFFDPDPTFCLPRFNHMILHIPSENMWLECTSNDNPTGYLGGFTQGRGVLLLTENGGKIVKTPALDATTNGQTSKATIQIAADGSATLKNASILRGSFQDDMRSILTNSSKEEFKKRFQESHKLPTFKIDALETSVERKKPEVSINYTFSFEKYGSKAGTRLFVPVNLHNAFDDTPAPTEKRIHPIEAGGSGYTETVETTLNLPEGYDVETIPTPKTELNSIYGSYSSTIEKSEKAIIFKRTMTIKPVAQPAEKFTEFRDFYRKMQQADAAKVVLKAKQ